MKADLPPALRTAGTRLVDSTGRDVILRGLNVGGDCKLPYPDGGTHLPTDFADHRTVSFIGRPFPLDEAPVHFGRIARWGFNCIRLLTTWEAVEHAGPGDYDEDYLDYFCAIVEAAGAQGLYVIVDFHQDVWSRMSGGAGAPGWTLEEVGLDIARISPAEGALVMQHAVDFQDPNPHQASYPQMAWSSNYCGPVNGIMWTLFWIGRHATPDFTVHGVNVQDFLRGRYLAAVDTLAGRLAGFSHVIGFDSLNEPGLGWVGTPLSERILPGDARGMRPVKPGPAWSPLESLALAQGLPVSLPIIERSPETLQTSVGPPRALNAGGVRMWREGAACPFEAAGIYRLEGAAAVARRENAFSRWADGQAIVPSTDLFQPFFHQVADVIRRHRKSWLLFAEMDPYALALGRYFPKDMPEGSVNASHWYDTRLLYTKRFHAVDEPLLARYRQQLGGIKAVSAAIDAPTFIGEFGTPYDLDGGRAYREWADGVLDDDIWAEQEAALGAMYGVLNELLIHSAQWNYTATNRNDPWIGDGWNQEDLSVYSVDQAAAHDGARARRGFDQPFVRAAQGQLRRMHFEPDTRRFEATIDVSPEITAVTEIHLPEWLCSPSFDIELSDPLAQWQVLGQCLQIRGHAKGPLHVCIRF